MEETAPFWTHVEALRSTLIKIFLVIGCSIIVSFFFHKSLYSFALAPLNDIPSERQQLEIYKISNSSHLPKIYKLALEEELVTSGGAFQLAPHTFLLFHRQSLTVSCENLIPELYITNPIEGMFIIFKLCMWSGAILSAPIWLYFLAQFFYPALNQEEKKALIPFIALSLIFMALGAIFALKVLIPLANQYLISFNQNLGKNIWSVSAYLDYSFLLMLGNSLAFELAAFGFFLVHLEFLTTTWLTSKRRHFILFSFIAGAILTPPDVMTQILMAGILIGAYEFVILYAKFRRWRSGKKLILLEHG